MKKQELTYLSWLGFHAFLGLLFFVVPFFSKIYALFVIGFGLYYVIKSENKNNEALLISAYIISIEVLLRMTSGSFINEYGKYSVMLFMFLGMVYSGFSNKGFLFWFFLLLLVPGIIIATTSLGLEYDIRKAIAFNLSGPACLGVCAVYCYERKITFERLLDVIRSFSFPLLSLAVYLFLYTPSVKDVVTGTQSNFETSGGFGPNQVSTILGFGLFIFFVQLLFHSKSTLMQGINFFLVLVFAFRGIVTFSRGGVFTGLFMLIVLMGILYFQASLQMKPKIGLIIIVSGLAAIGVWGYSSIQTGGLIDKRYANEDALGRKKLSKLSGREELMETELKMFFDNPILGVGVGRNKEIREAETGIVSASHNELTRMLAEHGSLGLLGLLILFVTPLYLFLSNRQNVFALSFMAFWLLTINHAAMRLAAPAFIYALSLLRVYSVRPSTTVSSP